MELEWKPVKNITSDPESVYTCLKCNNKIFCHVNYINAGIPACIRKACGNPEELSKRMVEYRGWTFKTTIQKIGTVDRKVDFSCDRGHDARLTYKSLKKGGSCLNCINQNKMKDKINTNVQKKSCLCGTRTCEHYNHGILYPDSATEWSDRNQVSIYQLAPRSMVKYIFNCRKCNAEYEQTLDKRSMGQRCPYCNGPDLVSYERSLECNYPDITKEYSSDNIIKPSSISKASNKNVWWECSKCQHKWSALICSRTEKKSGCPRCNCANYDAMVGGHDYFVQRANELHGYKYEYIGTYQSSSIKIDILCSIHGIFSHEPFVHLNGSGCPSCYYDTHMSKGEARIQVILDELELEYQKQKSFDGLCYQRSLKCDFYLPKFNLIVEYDGEQHFELTRRSEDNNEQLAYRKHKDIIKDLYMVKNKINLLRIPYTRYNQIRELIVTAIQRTSIGHVYASYPEYIVKIADQTSLENMTVVEITHIKLILVN